jgi:hypothetical protein
MQRRMVILDRQDIVSTTVDDLRRDIFLSRNRLSDLPSMANPLSPSLRKFRPDIFLEAQSLAAPARTNESGSYISS